MSDDALPDGWVVWSDEPARVVLAYRPDVFDGQSVPAACLPTLDVRKGRRDRRPGRQRVGEKWHVTLYLEPEVEVGTSTHDDREAALAAAYDRAAAFARGEVDYRAPYQVPRPAYFETLDRVVGASD